MPFLCKMDWMDKWSDLCKPCSRLNAVCSKTHICCMWDFERFLHSLTHNGWSTARWANENQPTIFMQPSAHGKCNTPTVDLSKSNVSLSFTHDIHSAYAVLSLNRPHIISGYHSHSCELHTFRMETTTPVLTTESVRLSVCERATIFRSRMSHNMFRFPFDVWSQCLFD